MNLAAQLRELGFRAQILDDDGDFVLRDDNDGKGPYIERWLSEKPCPFPELIREPHQ